MDYFKQEIKKNINILMNGNRLEKAKQLLKQYEEIVQNDVEIYSMNGIIAMLEQRNDDAQTIFTNGLKIDNQNVDLLYNLGYLYDSIDQKDKALNCYKQALQYSQDEELRKDLQNLVMDIEHQTDERKTAKNDLIVEKNARKASIVVLTYNNLEYTKLCIESIRAYTDPGTYEMIVVDNASKDDTVSWLKEQTDIKLILNSENQGFPKGCNQGIEIADQDNDILLLNNDTIVTPRWLENLNTCLYSSETIGAVGSVTNSCSNYQTIPVRYNNLDEMFTFAQNYNISDPTKWEERLRLVGYCMLIKRKVVNEIGLLDEIFTPGNFEDDDYSLRIRQAEYRLILCKDTFIHHFGSASFGKEANKYNALLVKNREKFMNKWGVDPLYIAEVRRDITAAIELQQDEINILQIGCFGGGTLLDIKNQIPHAKLYGIEMAKQAVYYTGHFADIHVGGLSEIKNFSKRFFNYIVITIHYENANDLIKVLEAIKPYLMLEGEIILNLSDHFISNSNLYIDKIGNALKDMKVWVDLKSEGRLLKIKYNKRDIHDDLPLVSILIPAYNRPEYLQLALESALNQTYSNVEIVICDDSTNDEVEKRVNGYISIHKNIRYYRNEKNLGQFDNDLKLFELASGEYVNYLMDDDLFEPMKIERMMQYFIADKKKEIKLVTSQRQLIDENGNILPESMLTQKIFKEDTIIDGHQLGNFVMMHNFNCLGEPTTVLFRKEDLIEPFGTFNGRRYGCNVDQAAWFTLLAKGKAVYIADTLSYFRIHSQQQLQTPKMKLLGALDYAHEILTAYQKGFLQKKEDCKVALENCISYVSAVFKEIQGQDMDRGLVLELQESIHLLNKMSENYSCKIEEKQTNILSNNLDRKLKFLLRRIENNIEYDQSLAEIIGQISSGSIYIVDLIENIRKNMIHKEKLLNTIALEFYKRGGQDAALEILMKSYELNPKDYDTAYNLAYITYKLGETETAITILDGIQQKDSDMISLMEEIMGEKR